MAPSNDKPRRVQPDENPIKVEKEVTDYNTGAMMVRTDQAILDPDHELAVQIPEGVGASAIDNVTPIEGAWTEARQVEDVFDAGEADAPTSPDNSVVVEPQSGDGHESHEH